MSVNIKKSIKHTLNNVGIPIVPTVLESQKANNPMAFYQSMDFSKMNKAQSVLNRFTLHAATGKLRAIAVTGPAGSGKTSSVMRMLANSPSPKYKCIAGNASPIKIYTELFFHKNPGDVIVLDDVDTVYRSDEGKNIIKAAADTIAQRKISWLTASPLLKALRIPSTFQYKGSLILISNVTLDSSKANKANVHLHAIIDRLHPVKMGTNNKEEQFHQLCYYVVHHGLFRPFGLSPQQEFEILKYITDNYQRIPSISLRTAVKLAELLTLEPEDWQEMASFSLLDEEVAY